MGKKLHRIAHFVSHRQIYRGNATNTLGEHLVHGYTGIERNGSQDGNLSSSIKAVNIGSGISFCKAPFLSFLQRVLVAHAVFVHAREHVVGGTVHDTHDGIDAVGNKGVLQGNDDGNSATNAGLKRNFYALFFRQAHNLFATRSHKGLVGSNHALAVLQSTDYHFLGEGSTADEFDNQINLRIFNHFMEIGGENVTQTI